MPTEGGRLCWKGPDRMWQHSTREELRLEGWLWSLVWRSEVDNIPPYREGNMEVPGQGRGTGNGQAYALTEHIPERRAAWCVPGQEMTFSGCDVGTSSFINFLGHLCQARVG